MQKPRTFHSTVVEQARAFVDARQALLQTPNGVESVILALIDLGHDTRDAIIKAVPRYVGHSYAHVARILDAGTGDDPLDNYWYRDQLKRYRAHQAEKKSPSRRKRASADLRLDKGMQDVPY